MSTPSPSPTPTPTPTPSPYPFPDLSLPAETILMNLLNEVNAATLPTPLTTSVCVFGDPAPFGGQGANTQIPFGTSNPAIFGTGTVNVTYNRIDVSQVIAAAQPYNEATMMSEALSMLNEEYALNLQASDIIDAPITGGVGNLNCNPASKIYCGNITLTFSTSNPTPTPVPAPAPTPTPSPTASFDYVVSNSNGLQVQFTDTSNDPTATITGWAWIFGDGGTSTVQNPDYTYQASGTYNAQLTITDENGSYTSSTQAVTVSDGSTPSPSPTPTPTPTPSPTPSPTPV
jgi:PKD repeat protein